MATHYTDIGLIQNDPHTNNSSKRTDAFKVTGNVNCATVIWTTDGTEVQDDFVRLVKLPPKIMILPSLCTVHTSVVLDASATNLSIGDDNTWTHVTPDPDRYMKSTDVVTADETIVWAPLGTSQDTAAMATPYVTTKEGWIDAKIVTATGTLAASGVATFNIFYVALT